MPDGKVHFDAYNVPADSVEKFIDASCKILEAEPEFASTWFLEPNEHQTVFRMNGKRLSFAVEDHGGHGNRKNQAEVLVVFNAELMEIMMPI